MSRPSGTYSQSPVAPKPVAPKSVDWVAVDWGTSNLRVWAMSSDAQVLDHATSPMGMSQLGPQDFEPHLLSLITPWLDDTKVMPVVACGMVGARQGWVNTPYAEVPCAPQSRELFMAAPVTDKRITVHVIHGLQQASPADVIRGEETQIAGFMDTQPAFEGLLCLPGTHSKWVHVAGGTVIKFHTFMTGELFALLSKESVLRHSVQTDQWNEAAFMEAVHNGWQEPETTVSSLFSLRASQLVHDQTPDVLRAHLSGLLIGTELASFKHILKPQRPVVLIGSKALSAAYAGALQLLGFTADIQNAETLTQRGLINAYHKLEVCHA